MVESFPGRLFVSRQSFPLTNHGGEEYRGARKEKLEMKVIINYDCFSNCWNVECLAIFQFVKHCSTFINLQLVATGTQAFTNAGKI